MQLNPPESVPFRAFFIGASISTAPVWGVISFIVAMVVGGNTDLKNIWILVWVGGTFGGVFLSALGGASKYRKAVNSSLEFLSDSLPRIDYWPVTPGVGIAVDLNAGKVALRGRCERKRLSKTVDLKEIRDVSAMSKEYEEVRIIGRSSSSERADILKDNIEQAAKASKDTGLTVCLDDLQTPQIFVQLDYSAAERWLFLFEKIQNGSAQSQDSPIELKAAG
jgi:hypothetical protein